jgi:hypothetical protein
MNYIWLVIQEFGLLHTCSLKKVGLEVAVEQEAKFVLFLLLILSLKKIAQKIRTAANNYTRGQMCLVHVLSHQ